MYRAVNHLGLREIGDKNNYGWKVVGIQKMYRGNGLSEKDYTALLRKRFILKRVGTLLIEFLRKIDPVQLFKWGFIGYAVMKLCK